MRSEYSITLIFFILFVVSSDLRADYRPELEPNYKKIRKALLFIDHDDYSGEDYSCPKGYQQMGRFKPEASTLGPTAITDERQINSGWVSLCVDKNRLNYALSWSWNAVSGATNYSCPSDYPRWLGIFIFQDAHSDHHFSAMDYQGNLLSRGSLNLCGKDYDVFLSLRHDDHKGKSYSCPDPHRDELGAFKPKAVPLSYSSAADKFNRKISSGWLQLCSHNNEIKVNFSEKKHPIKGIGWNVNANLLDLEIDKLFEHRPQFIRLVSNLEIFQPTRHKTTYFSPEMMMMREVVRRSNSIGTSVFWTNWWSGGKYQYNPSIPLADRYWMSEIAYKSSPPDPFSVTNWCFSDLLGSSTIGRKCFDFRDHYGPETDHPFNAEVFAETIVNIIALFDEEGLDIDYLSLWNEPNGKWAYQPRQTGRAYPWSFGELYHHVHHELTVAGLRDKINVSAMGDALFSGNAQQKEFLERVDYALTHWSQFTDSITMHNYEMNTGPGGVVDEVFEKVKGNRDILIGEVGDKSLDGCNEDSPTSWGNSLNSTRAAISDFRHGAKAVARWWWQGVQGECWAAVRVNPIDRQVEFRPEVINSVKILSETINRHGANVLLSNIDELNRKVGILPLSTFENGKEKIVIWAVNTGYSDYTANMSIIGKRHRSLDSKILNQQQNFKIRPYIHHRITGDGRLGFVIPARSILVLTEN